MKKGIAIALGVLITAGGMLSCEKKYEDGPAVSLTPRAERVANTWVFAYAEENGENVTDEFEQYELFMNTDNEAQLDARYSVFGIDYNTTTEGDWSFKNEEEILKFDFEDDNFDDDYEILRLLKEELWLKDTDRNLEIHLLAK